MIGDNGEQMWQHRQRVVELKNTLGKYLRNRDTRAHAPIQTQRRGYARRVEPIVG